MNEHRGSFLLVIFATFLILLSLSVSNKMSELSSYRTAKIINTYTDEVIFEKSGEFTSKYYKFNGILILEFTSLNETYSFKMNDGIIFVIEESEEEKCLTN